MPLSARRALTLAIAAAAIFQAACGRDLSFSPPRQKTMPSGVDEKRSAVMLAAAQGFRGRAVADMMTAEAGSQWVWTNQHPRFRMGIDRDDWELVAHFTVAKVVLDKVGPVTVSLVLNDRVLAKRTFAKDGAQELRSNVAVTLLNLNEPETFGLDVNPVFVAEADGAKLGVLLEAIGFERVGSN